MRGLRFENGQAADDAKRLVLHRPFVPNARRTRLGLGHFIHRHLPRAGRRFCIGRGEVVASDLPIKDRLSIGFAFSVKQGESFVLVLGAETQLLASGPVLVIVNARSPEQVETRFHVRT